MFATRKLGDKSTAGPDGIPSFLVRDCIRVLALPLVHIFNLALRKNTYPSCWKLSKIIAVFKKGNKSDIQSYRPISILSNFSKIFEIILFNAIFPKVSSRIKDQQHGFMPRRSCLSNLAVFSQSLVEVLDGSGQLDVAYMDFHKAFDSVDHGRLIAKLERMFGFTGGLIGLIASYLHDRRQYVQIENYRSGQFVASSGVPQGSNLGPLLFLLFVNDLMDEVSIPILMFADDLKLYLEILSELDCIILQKAIDVISAWCCRNRLALNGKKCYIVSYTRRKEMIKYSYNMKGNVLNRLTQTRDLGVIFDERCTFLPHMDHVVSSACRLYGFLIRNGKCFTCVDTYLSLFNSLIRSKLEYASMIWRPIYQCHIHRLEAVQRKFFKFLAWKQDGEYPPIGYDHKLLLSRFKGRSLETRRGMLALSFIYKLLNNRVDCPALLEKLPILVPRLEGRTNFLFYLRAGKTNLNLKSPIHYMCNIYNKIANRCDINDDPLYKLLQVYVELDIC